MTDVSSKVGITLSPTCRDPLPPLSASIAPLQPLTQLGPSQGNKPALVQTSPLVWYWWLSLPPVVWTMTGQSHRNIFRAVESPDTLLLLLLLLLHYINPCIGSDHISYALFFHSSKTETKWRYPHAQYKINQDHTHNHTHTRALTDLLIKTDSVLAHLINPQRQLPGENRPHYARKKNKTMTPSASRDSFANGRPMQGRKRQIWICG